MPSPYSAAPPSDQSNPRGRQLSSSAAGMAATQLPSFGARALPPPFPVTRPERPVLPPLSLGPENPSDNAPYHTGRTWSTGHHQSPDSPFQYGQQTFQDPSQVPWRARLPLERVMSRHEQDRPISSGAVHPSSSSSRASYGSYAYQDPSPGSAERTRVGVPSMPSPSGQDLRLQGTDATRYTATTQSTRRESEGSSRSSATSSSAYGSAMSISAQPTATASSQSSEM